jgi:Ca2+-binding RTX toxin-like protein
MAAIRGDGRANTLRGTDDEPDQIFGLGGDDHLISGGGVDDVLWGGTGNDLLESYAWHNELYGEAGDDTLLMGLPGAGQDGIADGGAGNDVIRVFGEREGSAVGGDGDDRLIVDGEVPDADGGAGSDRIMIFGSSVHVDAGDGDDRMDAASELESHVLGGAGNDRIITDDREEPGGGFYRLTIHNVEGGAGNDTITAIGNGIDAKGGAGNDVLTGSNDATYGADLLYGLAGNDRLVGRAGNDKLGGGHGVDVMSGGAGRDIFDVNAGDSGIGMGKRDLITDFARGSDRIDLISIDAVAGGADQKFAFIGTRAFTAAGQLRFFHEGDHTVIQGSTDADRAPEFELQLSGRIALAATDFHL